MAIGVQLATVNNKESAQAGGAASPRLVRAAHEFEGMMMKELLKPMTEPMTSGDGLTGDGEDGDDSGSSGALGEFAGETLGQGLSLQGGFGIADRIVAQLSHSGNAAKNGKVTEKMHSNTVMGAAE